MPRNAKQFVSPSLNLFRVKDSKSTYARTKVPAYLVAADPDLKRMFNWGKVTDETRPEIEANHERLMCRLRLVDARLKEGRDPAPKPVLRSAPADMPASITELVQRFIEYEINTLREAKGLRVGRTKKSHQEANMRLKLEELVLEHGTMPADEFMGRHLAEIRERMMNHGLHKSQKAPTIRYGGMILDAIRRVFDHGMFMGWVPAEVCEQLKKVRMIRNDRRASAPREQRVPTNEELNHFCSLMDELDPVRGVLEFMQASGCRVAQALRMRWCDIRPCQAEAGWYEYLPPVEEGCSFSKGTCVWITPDIWMNLQRFRTRDGKLAPAEFPVFDASTRKGGPVTVKAGTAYKCNSLFTACRRHADRHGLPRISPTTLRKLAAMNEQQRSGFEGAQARLNHQTPKQTANYLAHVTGQVPQVLKQSHQEVG